MKVIHFLHSNSFEMQQGKNNIYLSFIKRRTLQKNKPLEIWVCVCVFEYQWHCIAWWLCVELFQNFKRILPCVCDERANYNSCQVHPCIHRSVVIDWMVTLKQAKFTQVVWVVVAKWYYADGTGGILFDNALEIKSWRL